MRLESPGYKNAAQEILFLCKKFLFQGTLPSTKSFHMNFNNSAIDCRSLFAGKNTEIDDFKPLEIDRFKIVPLKFCNFVK